MLKAILAFAAGIGLCQQWAQLLSWQLVLIGGVLSWLGYWMLKSGARLPILRPIAYPLCLLTLFSLGLAYATGRAELRLADQLSADLEGQDIQVEGVVAGLPHVFDRALRFVFRIEHVQVPANVSFPSQVMLSWYANGAEEVPQMHGGEHWRLTVRLKRPHGSVNPHGFDYEGWLFEHGIRATGYVRRAQSNRLLAPSDAADFIVRWREAIRARMTSSMRDAPYTGVLIALTVGDQAAISAEQWELFRRTGVTHLMSISGLHVTLVGALAAFLCAGLWRSMPRLLLYLPAQKVAAIAGALAACAYALIAGFGIPAQRTLYMLLVVAWAVWTGRAVAVEYVLAWALCAVLLIDPWAVLSAGFWLSFGAVAVLMYVAKGRVGRAGTLHAWWQAQWAITLGSMPVLLVLFHQFSLISPIANAIAIPLVSMAITPLALAYAIVPVDFLFRVAHGLTAWLMQYLSVLADGNFAVWHQAAPPALLAGMALIGIVWALLPRGMPARGCALLPLLALLFWMPLRPEENEARLTVLDVGQGLAIHIQTREHDLLYDTGPRYSDEADSGNRIIVPYFEALGISHLNGMIVSHQDQDHVGGAQSVFDAMPVDWLLSSLEESYPLRNMPQHRHCSAGQKWQWDGVSFEIIHPAPEAYVHLPRKRNNLSCVLKVTTPYGKVLVTGDIEAVAERELVLRDGARLGADVLVVPHHGSKTSSSELFLQAVSPKWAWVSVGYRNRFRHPDAQVLERYRHLGVGVFRTDTQGALQMSLTQSGQDGVLGTMGERAQRPRYWFGR